jgi:hypothetical protein
LDPQTRKIDRLIAEKVMGWEKDKKQTERWDTSFGLLHEYDWEPSTDISDAWEVVEKMKEMGFNYFMQDCYTKSHAVTFIHWINTENGKSQKHYDNISETAPMAICLAALKAVNSE